MASRPNFVVNEITATAGVAISTVSTGPPDRDTITRLPPLHTLAAETGKHTVHEASVAMADPARLDRDPNLSVSRIGQLTVGK